jgi:hypothetical protein
MPLSTRSLPVAGAVLLAGWSASYGEVRPSPGDGETKPSPTENLRTQVAPNSVKLNWTIPAQSADIRYYVDVCRLEGGGWQRLFGMYARHPPFTIEHPKPQARYAWRVLSVDAGDQTNFTATEWQFFVMNVKRE